MATYTGVHLARPGLDPEITENNRVIMAVPARDFLEKVIGQLKNHRKGVFDYDYATGGLANLWNELTYLADRPGDGEDDGLMEKDKKAMGIVAEVALAALEEIRRRKNLFGTAPSHRERERARERGPNFLDDWTTNLVHQVGRLRDQLEHTQRKADRRWAAYYERRWRQLDSSLVVYRGED